MMTYEDLDDMPSTQLRPGVWVRARPCPAPLSWRLRDAWEVLRGRAEAVRQATADEATLRLERTQCSCVPRVSPRADDRLSAMANPTCKMCGGSGRPRWVEFPRLNLTRVRNSSVIRNTTR